MENDKKKRLLATIICMLLFFTAQFFLPVSHAMAAQKVSGIEQMEEVFKKSIKKGERTIHFTATANYTNAQIQNALNEAAKSQGSLLSGGFQIGTSSSGANPGIVNYTIQLSQDTLMKVKVLKSEKAAVKAAAKALKSGKYSTNFYSEDSYYEVFYNLLQEHPEYNYGTAVWKNSNGAYGYRRADSLTKKQQAAKMQAADSAAAKAVKKCIKSGMTDRQKAKAIHDYIVKNCVYGGTGDAFTAYGMLVDGRAVCQGYAAAFNLMAKKCGLQSMTVCGTARGGAHAWTYVKIGKKYRYIDCTWDDTEAVGNGIVYTYFLVDAEKMRGDHIWNDANFSSSDIKYTKYF